MTTSNSPEKGPWSRVGKHVLTGFVVLAVSVGGFGYWAATAAISGAAVATGTVGPENSRRSVQHFEGGVVEEIHVRDGDVVKRGEILLRLDDTAARASVETQNNLILALEAQKERLEAEYRMLSDRDLDFDLVFSDALTSKVGEVRASRDMLKLEQQRFDSARAAIASSVELHDQAIRSYGIQIEGYERQLQSVRNQRVLLEEDLEVLEPLWQRGLEIRRSMSEKRLQLAQTELIEAERRGSVESLREAIRLAELEREALWTSSLEETVESISSVTGELLAARTTYDAYRNILERTVVRAPVSGTLIGMTINTVGGVLAPGEAFVEIVPADEALTLEARVDPKDISIVEAGQTAVVALLSYPRRSVPSLHGRVVSVSPDSLIDTTTGESYYLAKVVVDEDALKALGEGIAMVPGMPVEVTIEISSRTFFDYLLEPLLRYRDRALRET